MSTENNIHAIGQRMTLGAAGKCMQAVQAHMLPKEP